jgi:ribosomal protein S18 acetylase RimI-like enzyme
MITRSVPETGARATPLAYGGDVVLVRPAQAGEVEAAVELWELANAARRLPSHPERIRSWARGPGAVLFVADHQGELVGMTLSLPGRADDGAGQLVPGLRHLTGVCVRPDRQGMGLGGRLLDAVLDHARQEGCDRVTLWTARANDRARRLFHARGFRATGRTIPDELGAPMDHFEASLAVTAAGTLRSP